MSHLSHLFLGKTCQMTSWTEQTHETIISWNKKSYQEVPSWHTDFAFNCIFPTLLGKQPL